MKAPRNAMKLDTNDALVLLALIGLGCVVRGVSILSVPWAWIVAGVVLIAWSVWRLMSLGGNDA